MSPSNHDVGILGRFSVRLTVAVVLGIATIATYALYLWLPQARNYIVFGAALVGGAATVYAAYYAASTLRVHVKRDMQSRSFQILASLNEHEAAKLRVFIEKEVADRRMSPDALYKRITEDTECLAVVTAVLGLYEDTAVAIQEGFADERTLYRSLDFVIPWTLRNLREYIDQERTRNYAPDLYIELQRLTESWNGGRFLRDGSPIPKDILARAPDR